MGGATGAVLMYSNTGFGLIAAASLGLSFSVGSYLFEQPFLTVHEISYVDGTIYADRTVNRSVVGDWRVTIVQEDRDGPTCNTIPGTDIHEGWSPYSASPRQVRSFSLDVWVNDTGCLERLEKGSEHHMFMSWSPRDDSDPVAYKLNFVP